MQDAIDARSKAGVFLLRAALIGGIYVIVIVAATIRPMPWLPHGAFEVVSTLSSLALCIALIAPLLAIVGAVLTRLGRRRFTALDWTSLAFGIVPVLQPALFFLAYSNCPRGYC